MPQVTIYLDKDVADKVKRAAKAEGQSVSKWMAERASEHVNSQWSQEVLDACGAFPDFPMVEEIRANDKPDLKREKW